MSRNLNDLTEPFRGKAIELLARLTEANVQVMIVCTGRTQAEQDEAFATALSKVRHSRHQDGLAIDICPFNVWQLHGEDKLQWDGKDLVWPKIGVIGEGLGLRWGGRFQPLNEVGVGWDPGHFEEVS